jgi:HicB family
MKTSPYAGAVASDLHAVAAVGGDALVAAAERLAGALEASIRLRLIEALGEAAAELSSRVPSGHVEARLVGGDVELAYVAEPSGPEEHPADDPATARITLRLSERLKARVEAAAAREGESVNTWLVRAAAQRAARRPWGNRVTGFARG